MKKLTFLLISLIVVLFFVGCNCNTCNTKNTDLSQQRLTKIDTMINGYISSGKLSGATVLISRNNQVAYLKSYGYSNIADSILMKNNCIYSIASMTKLVTAVGALILYEKGYFRLNDELSDYLPQFKNMSIFINTEKGTVVKPAANPILVKDLFRHTSGITYGSKEYSEAGAVLNKARSLEEFVQNISKVPLYHEPGTTFEYSYSTDILGYLIEKLSGQTLRDFLIENIFNPLKMDDTDFYVPEDKKSRLVNFYEYNNNNLIIKEAYDNSVYNKLPDIYSGGGGLVSTVYDYSRFLQMILNYGHYNNLQILSRKTVELMITDQIANIENKGFLSDGRGHGLGVGLIPDAGAYGELFSSGSIFWAGIRNTYFWVDFRENMYGILMTQMTPFVYLPIMDEFRILTYQAISD